MYLFIGNNYKIIYLFSPAGPQGDKLGIFTLKNQGADLHKVWDPGEYLSGTYCKILTCQAHLLGNHAIF